MKNTFKLLPIVAMIGFGTASGAAHALTPGPITFSNNTTSFDANFGNDSVIAAFTDHHTFTAVASMFGSGGASVISGFNFTGANVLISSFDLWDTTTTTLVAPGTVFTGIVGSLSFSGLTSGDSYDLVLTGAPAVAGFAGGYGGNISISPIPEPETYAMFMAGLGLMGFMARRRSKTS